MLGFSFLPAASHIVSAARHLAGLEHGRAPTGQCRVESAPATLPTAIDRLGAPASPITFRLWRPAPVVAPAGRPGGIGLSCAGMPPLLLYLPGNGAGREDAATTSENLASHGYLVAALDDVERNSAGDGLHFDFSSQETYARMLQAADRKADLQARRALRVLDSLAAGLEVPGLGLVRIDETRIGAYGFSFGGASAAEAATLDRRIAAAANLDGWLFGRAARGDLVQPYLLLMGDYAPLAPGNEADLTRRDLQEEARLGARPGSAALRVAGAIHETFSDQILRGSFAAAWLKADQHRLKAVIDACLLTFFDRHLRAGRGDFDVAACPELSPLRREN